MTPALTRPQPHRPHRGTASLLVGLLLAGIALAGCDLGPAGEPAQPVPAPAPLPASGSPTRDVCGQAPSGLEHSAEGPGSRRFEITRQQLEVIGRHLIEVFCRQGLWRQDVGFGVHYEKDPNKVLVLIGPGRSGLTARQILDRLLGRG
ncbi:MAG TPA: hypothetical protein VF486_13380 [Actinomycetes bacterium]